jgi:hypothetical protein
VRTSLRAAGFSDPGTLRHGVRTYRLRYRTVDAQQRPTIASGLLVLPLHGARRLTAVSSTHGTTTERSAAPSVSTDDYDTAPAVTFGAGGFAAVAPDYLGLGVEPGLHPWMDLASETSASLDMLRAARTYVTRTGRTLERRVLVTGFSEGASAALGLAKALQDGADPHFALGATAPISGAYAMRDAEIPALLNGRLDPKLSVIYAALLYVAYDRLHDLYQSPDEVFHRPYAARVTALFNGVTPAATLFRTLPDRLDDLLTAEGRARLQHPTGSLAEALSVADAACSWKPAGPLRLYFAHGDEQAATANTAHCAADFTAAGRSVDRVVLAPHDFHGSRHVGSNVEGTAAVARWFAKQ